jgi:AcrR family transcriptional regulator
MLISITSDVTDVNTVLSSLPMPEKSRARTRHSGPALRKRKGAYHHGNLRLALIDAGLALIDEEGPTALSLRAVAQRVGVSAAAPYRHFPSREALLAAVAERGFRLLGEELRRAIDAHDDPARRLGESGIAYVLYAATHRARYSLMFGPELAERSAHPSLEAAADDTSRLLLDAVEELRKAGQMSSRDRDDLSLSAWSSVHGLASLMTSGHIRVAGSDRRRIQEIARGVARWVVPGFDA